MPNSCTNLNGANATTVDCIFSGPAQKNNIKEPYSDNEGND
jgi:hypothetical protein